MTVVWGRGRAAARKDGQGQNECRSYPQIDVECLLGSRDRAWSSDRDQQWFLPVRIDSQP